MKEPNLRTPSALAMGVCQLQHDHHNARRALDVVYAQQESFEERERARRMLCALSGAVRRDRDCVIS